MNAKPFGTFTGIKEIQAFWQGLIDQGVTEVKYHEPQIVADDENMAVLSSAWSMNKAQGIITKELWVIQKDGSVLLLEDDFEAQN